MTNLRSLSDLLGSTGKLLAACAFATAIAATASAQTNTFPADGNAGIGTTSFDAGTSGLQIQPASRSKFGLLVTDTDGSRAGGLYIDSDGFGQLYLFDSGGTLRVHIAASSQDHTYFNSGGNVGIGTTTPSQKLNVIGNGLFGNLTSRTLLYSTYDSQQNPFLEVGNGTSHSAITPLPFFVLSNNTTSTSNAEGIIGQFVFANRSIADNNDKRTAVITSWVDGASNSGTLQFYTNSAGTVAERVRITSGGNVGIGTTNPQTRFDIKQSVDSFVGGLHLRRSTTNDTWALVTGGDNNLYMGYANNASGADAASDFTVYPLVLTGSGKVGIGTANPIYSLDVNGGVNGFRAKAATTSSSDAIVTVENAAGIQAIVRGNGNIGMGTTNPNYKLDVNGEINATGIRINGTPISGGGSPWQGTGSIYYNGGNVGIGTQTPVTTFHVIGDATVSNNIAINGATVKPWQAGKAVQGTTGALFLGNSGDTHLTSNAYTTSTGTGWKYMTAGTAANFHMYQGSAVFRNALSGSADADVNWVNRMVITADGNVGINQTNPQARLSVLSDDSTTNNVTEVLRLSHTTTGTATNGLGSRIAFTAERASGVEILTGYIDSILTDATNVDSALLFHTRDNGGSLTERVRIDSVGNVGIGTTTPGDKLAVVGVISSSSGGFRFPDGSLQTTAASGGGGGTITGVTAGSGLTGGGATGSVTLNVGAGTGIIVAADTVSVNYGSTAGTAVEGNKSITVSAGNGMSGGGALTLGSGGTVTLTNADKGSSQDIFKNVANSAGTTQFSAASNTDAIRFAGSGGTSVTFDAATKKITIDGSTSTIPAANVTAGQFGAGNYTFPGNLIVNGTINAKYQDVAEWVPSSEQLSAGTVVVLDTTKSNQVIASAVSYDTRVAGVISAQPGIALGEGGGGKVLVATTGRVRVKVDASRGAIQIGDLLVTSDVSGVAMKSEAVEFAGRKMHMPGTIIGKALEPLAKGSGEILVLLSLQ